MDTHIPKDTQQIYIAFFVLLCCHACMDNNRNKGWLLSRHSYDPKDSLKLECLIFLQENGRDLSSETTSFYDPRTGNKVEMPIDSLLMQDNIKAYLKSSGVEYFLKRVPDSLLKVEEQIKRDVNKAMETWKRFPWNEDVPKDVFLNYVLPYKVYDELPGDWRSAFANRYKHLADSLIDCYDTSLAKKEFYSDPNEIYYRTVVEDAGKWFQYTEAPGYLSSRPGYREMMKRRKGDCVAESYLSAYILRALGVPATVDFVPAWGSKNSLHYGVVFYKKNRMVAPSGREFVNPAKVFRLTFKRQNIWTDSILPYIKKAEFSLKELKHDHWMDVTNEHTNTIDISYQLADSIKAPFAYICVMNYGSWQPIYWSPISIMNTATFKKMGCRMLYQIAIPEFDGSYKLAGDTFMVDSLGAINEIKPDLDKTLHMVLSKLNTGAKSYVSKNEQYSLYVYTGKDKWELVQTQKCKQDSSIRFSRVPANGLYRLLKESGDGKLERVFTYENNRQVWW